MCASPLASFGSCTRDQSEDCGMMILMRVLRLHGGGGYANAYRILSGRYRGKNSGGKGGGPRSKI